MIWFKEYSLDEINSFGVNTMVSHLGIEFTEIGADFIKATMPVNKNTIQPAGLLHGGASVALAETIGSVGSHLTVDPQKYNCVGLEINANHIKAKKSGVVTGKGVALHRGKTTQIWEIKITDESERLVCVSRITMAILEQNK
ncbi:MAG: hotdog fold thioesterase [Calditrichae bacterium]|nr:hotdog fold thioesterase [Calditrichota bacterium]MCB9058573.1 hotdog fold thioesterase [Calditrichia bacterium]